MGHSRSLRLALAAAALSLPLGTSALAQAAADTNPAANLIDGLQPVTDEMLKNLADGDWLMWRRAYNGWGYSPLDQIDKDNVGQLQLAWSWAMTPGAT